MTRLGLRSKPHFSLILFSPFLSSQWGGTTWGRFDFTLSLLLISTLFPASSLVHATSINPRCTPTRPQHNHFTLQNTPWKFSASNGHLCLTGTNIYYSSFYWENKKHNVHVDSCLDILEELKLHRYEKLRFPLVTKILNEIEQCHYLRFHPNLWLNSLKAIERLFGLLGIVIGCQAARSHTQRLRLWCTLMQGNDTVSAYRLTVLEVEALHLREILK